MKRLMTLLLVFTLLFSITACASTAPEQPTTGSEVAESTVAPDTDEKPLSGKIKIWSSGEELGRFVEGFNKIYPDITVEITVVPNADFIAKLTPTLSSGQDAPDLFTGESDYVKYLVDSPFWDDLSNYGVETYTPDVWDYVLSVGTDNTGVIKALSWQASPGSIMYRRDMAKRVLGTDDPTEVSALLSSYDKMMSVAATMKENGIKMFASWQDLMNMQFSNRTEPWVKDNKLIIDDSMLNFMDMAKTISENGYDLNSDPWSGEWFGAVEGEDTFCYVLPTWGYQFVVKPSAVKTMGQWALAEGPVPYVKGGTWLGIYKQSQNKELAWKFLEYVCLNTEAQQDYAKEYGEYVSLKSADQSLAKDKGEDVLNGQNLYAFFNDQMSKIPNDFVTAYDGQINTAFLSATKAYVSGALTKDEAIQTFKDDVATAYPDLIIE
ncbi:ABC transporter substrate-binding protein [Fusibacter bizertensis]